MMPMALSMHPIWQSGGIILVGCVLAAMLLQVVAHRILPLAVRREHTALGAAIFSVIGTTYAVLLAFMATTAWQQYSAAQELARHEADLVGSIYRASHGIADPAGAAMRDDLMAYLAKVINVEWPAQVAGRAVPAVEPLLVHLGRMVTGLAPAGAGQANIQNFLVSAVSEVVTVRRDRRLATHGNIPDLVWMVLLSGGGLVVAFSFLLGAPSLLLHLLMTAALAASGVLVLLLVVGLSSPFHGAVTIPPDAYAGVLAEITASP